MSNYDGLVKYSIDRVAYQLTITNKILFALLVIISIACITIVIKSLIKFIKNKKKHGE